MRHDIARGCEYVFAVISAHHAAGQRIRCSTRLVANGDSVTHLLKVCGKPAMKFRARDKDKRSGHARSVQQWVYERGRRAAMVVSILDGKVVRIRRD